MTILDHVFASAQKFPDKPAIIHQGEEITYSRLYPMMKECRPLPIPLLGEGWDKTFCLHTTGTTGQAKDVLISQQAVIANSENLIKAQLVVSKVESKIPLEVLFVDSYRIDRELSTLVGE